MEDFEFDASSYLETDQASSNPNVIQQMLDSMKPTEAFTGSIEKSKKGDTEVETRLNIDEFEKFLLNPGVPPVKNYRVPSTSDYTQNSSSLHSSYEDKSISGIETNFSENNNEFEAKRFKFEDGSNAGHLNENGFKTDNMGHYSESQVSNQSYNNTSAQNATQSQLQNCIPIFEHGGERKVLYTMDNTKINSTTTEELNVNNNSKRYFRITKDDNQNKYTTEDVTSQTDALPKMFSMSPESKSSKSQPVSESQASDSSGQTGKQRFEMSSQILCEMCGVGFKGSQPKGAKMSHLVGHFRDKLVKDIKEMVAPFKCPVDQCPYNSDNKAVVIRHYGCVHNVINKLMEEYLKDNPNKALEVKQEANVSTEGAAATESQKEPTENSNKTSEKSKDELKCPLCSFTTTKRCYITAHFKRMHPNDKSPFARQNKSASEGTKDETSDQSKSTDEGDSV